MVQMDLTQKLKYAVCCIRDVKKRGRDLSDSIPDGTKSSLTTLYRETGCHIYL